MRPGRPPEARQAAACGAARTHSNSFIRRKWFFCSVSQSRLLSRRRRVCSERRCIASCVRCWSRPGRGETSPLTQIPCLETHAAPLPIFSSLPSALSQCFFCLKDKPGPTALLHTPAGNPNASAKDVVTVLEALPNKTFCWCDGETQSVGFSIIRQPLIHRHALLFDDLQAPVDQQKKPPFNFERSRQHHNTCSAAPPALLPPQGWRSRQALQRRREADEDWRPGLPRPPEQGAGEKCWCWLLFPASNCF